MNLTNKRVLAIDYGTKFTGLAQMHVGNDPFVLLFGRIKYESDLKLAQQIKQIAEDEFMDILVLGVPYFTDGKSSTMTQKILDFKKVLSEQINLPIYEQDETLSSYEAQEKMRNDPRFNFQVDMTQIDAVAASIILEDFLRKYLNN